MIRRAIDLIGWERPLKRLAKVNVNQGVRRFTGNLANGIGLGALVATGFSLWVTAVRLSNGTTPFDRIGTTYTSTVELYYTGFLIGGTIVGLLMPLRNSPLGSMLLGFFGVLPVYCGVIVQTFPRSEWLSTIHIVAALSASAIVGSLSGLRLWSLEHREQKERSLSLGSSKVLIYFLIAGFALLLLVLDVQFGIINK